MKHLIASILLLTSFNLSAQIPSYLPTENLVGWWPFNGNANDESGNGIHGIVNGASLTSDRNGAQDSAYSFDGTSNYIAIPTLDANSYTDVSVSGWFNTDGASGDNQVIFSVKNGRCWIPIFDITQIMGANFENNDGSNPFSVTEQTGLITPTNWHHFAIVITGNTMNLYFDGTLVDSTASASFVDDVYGFTEIGASGRSNDSRNNYFDGSIDDIGIWNRALDLSEIEDLYNASEVNTCAADLNGDGTVDINDFLIFNSAFGTDCGE